VSTISLTPLERKLFDAPETWNMSPKEAARVLVDKAAALLDKLCGILNASTFENAVEIVVGLCENGIISAEHVLRVKRRLHLMRQLRELESTIS
jgi:hypothetical protein